MHSGILYTLDTCDQSLACYFSSSFCFILLIVGYLWCKIDLSLATDKFIMCLLLKWS